jgi:glycosyltransferase involved in cell wall biosynthesis
MVKDEQDIIGVTVRHMLDEVDHVIVADNMSTDFTPEILDNLAETYGRLLVIDDLEPAYFQSAKMTALALRARLEFGAEWIVPFDADEWWYSPYGRIADILTEQRLAYVVSAPTCDHVMTALDPEVDVNPIYRMGWRRSYQNPLPKVACRWADDMVIGQGNHEVFYDNAVPRIDGILAIHHYPMRSLAQLVRKVKNGAAAYKAGGEEIPLMYGAHWRQWGEILESGGEEAIEGILKTYYWREQPDQPLFLDGEEQSPLVYDPARRTW